MTVPLYKLILAPSLVGLASVGAALFGARVGGMLAALPIVGGPALFIYATEHGTAFAQEAAAGTLLGVVALSGFCVAHPWLAKLLTHRPRALSMPVCLVGGWLAYLLVAALLRPLQGPAWLKLAMALTSLYLSLRSLPAPGDLAGPRRRHHPAVELTLRMTAAALIVWALALASAQIGPVWSGLLASFPVASSVLVGATHLAEGPSGLPPLLRGFLQGLAGFCAFLIVLALGLQGLGIPIAFALGLLAAFLCQAVILKAIPTRKG